LAAVDAETAGEHNQPRATFLAKISLSPIQRFRKLHLIPHIQNKLKTQAHHRA
jgi:hypothetical protein